MFYTIKDSFVFDDIMLKPQYSTIKSRSDIDTSVKLGQFNFKHPLIPSNMKSLFSKDMISETISNGGLSILHRFMEYSEQFAITEEVINKYGPNNFGVSVGIKSYDREVISDFVNCGVKIICVDVAHSDTPYCIEMVQWIKTKYPDTFLIVGNISTGDAAKRM